MSLGASGLIKMIDFEVSSICNAGCSVCMRRRDGHYSEFVSTYWSVADVKRVLDLDIVKNLGTITMCGNFGDAMGNPDIVEIVEWLRITNPKLKITIKTNGGIGDKEKYKRLGELGVIMTFGLDGVGEKNELYRVNVKWDKVLENVNSFVSSANPDQFEIQFIMWAETTDQIVPMIDFIKSLGMGKLYLRKPFTTGIKTEVYNIKGESTHFLTEISETYLFPYLDTFWEFKDLFYLRQEIDNINIISKPLEISDLGVKPRILFPEAKYAHETPVFKEHELKHIQKHEQQTCYSKNMLNPSDLKNSVYNVFITYDKLLMPCCMIPPNVSNSLHHYSGQENGYQREILNKMTSLGLDNFSLKNKTLKEVFNSGILDRFVYNDLINGEQFNFCKITCGKCKD